ncbi:MAG: hypothetical protein VYB05_07720 [Pseudomonadota bacterium]|nr:hypothetical protein [Pseudomonadota bacterium]
MTEIGHNSDEQDQLAEQTFLRVFNEVKEGKSDIGERMADINEAYKSLKPHGYTKADIKFAMELEEKDAGDIIATMQRRIRIAKMFGHGLARQFDMFEEDRTPIEERAYEEGLAAGKLRKGQGANPYDATSAAGQAWLKGEAEGNAFANKDLSHVMDEPDPEFPDEEPEAAEA